jgi:N-acetylneuraminic acid mutarotase
MNAGACFLGPNYVYCFGGVGASEYLNSIERFNTKFKIWTTLRVVLPTHISNHFAVPVGKEEILIVGGLKPNSSGASAKKFEIESKLVSFNTRKETF